MKKYLIIGLILAFVATVIFVPLFKNNDAISDEQTPAVFAFKDNLAAKWGEVVPLIIHIQRNEIAKLELVYGDSVFHVWNNPSGTIKIPLNAAVFGLGTRSLQLVSTMKDGTSLVDDRLLRVLSDVLPESWDVQEVQAFPHSETSFTQGLEFDAGKLYEGTGQKGHSLVAQVDLKSGKQLQKMGLDANYFGEGITLFGDELFQLTWQEQTCFVYDKKTLQLKRDIRYVGEGWGLCNDGSSLIMSDGSERITFRNPKTFEIERTIEVYTNQGPVTNLNELEYADDLIYANVWMTNKIIVIDPRNGKVLAEIDATELVNKGRGNGDVLNGIAFNGPKMYVTGKNWNTLFEIKLKKPNV